MDGLILAAGLGSRLRQAEPCKPLTRIHGKTLLELSIRQLVAAGVDRVIVATGYKAAEVEAELSELSSKLKVDIAARRVPDFTKPNGHSILAAADILSEQFLLVMADHIFDLSILRILANKPPVEDGVTLAVDRCISSDLIDPDDATWVEIESDGQISKIGKHICSYNAVDCGAFRASLGLLRAIETAIGKGMPGSLSDGMQELADRGLAWTREIEGAWWIDVDDPASLNLAKEQCARHLPHIFGEGEVAGAKLNLAVEQT